VGLERGPLSLVSTTEELLDRKVVGLERGPLSLVSTTEELLGRERTCAPKSNVLPSGSPVVNPKCGPYFSAFVT
jgi:hypothetical protein